MLCDLCEVREAAIKIIRHRTMRFEPPLYLCEECAREQGMVRKAMK
jgi:protein-arginine kinase activator protein McsA